MVLDATAAAGLEGVGRVALVGALGAVLARRLRLPTVVGFLAGGFLAGPLLGIVGPDPLLEALGELGVALLLFLVGIDLSLDEARAVGPPALGATLIQLGLSAAGGYALARALGFDAPHALFLAIALGFSSTVVVVKLLMDLDDLRATYGRLAVGVFLVQDIVVVLLLTLLPALAAPGAFAQPGALALDALLATGRMALLAGGAILASRTLLPLLFSYAGRAPPFAFLLGLAWLFLALALSQILGVSAEVGAFLAGLSLAPLPHAQELRRRTRPLLDLFVALFFVTLAAGLSLARAVELLPGALAFALFVILGKAVILTTTLVLMGYPRRTSLRTGITVGQVSEFSIVLATLALGQGLVDERVRDFVILVAAITIAASGVLIWHAPRIERALERLRSWRAVPDGKRDVGEPEAPPEGHVLVVGWKPLSEHLAAPFVARRARVVALAAHPKAEDHALPAGIEARYGDPDDPGAAEAAGLARARIVLSHLEDPDVPRVLATLPGAPPIVAIAHDADAAAHLDAEGLDVIHPERLLAGEAARAVIEEARDG